ncbi:MAG: cytochrome c oxidase subunit 3 [Bacteroidia bacterium]
MSAETETLEKPKSVWGGGRSPFNISWGKMYMWFFLVSDAFTFSSLLVSYGTLRHKYTGSWPKANDVFTHFPFIEQHVPLAYVALMTFILIMSSVTMVLAVDAGHRRQNKPVALWLGLTIIGGLMFVGSQAWEWYHFITGTEHGAYILADNTVAHIKHGTENVLILNGREIAGAEATQIMSTAEHFHGANLTKNEYGNPLFGDFFFFITGFHGFHVFSGVCINLIIWFNVLDGIYKKRGHYEQVEKTGLYWHFVDLVWVFVFTFFYLV